jgi:phage terminase large subunit GpA-like protein
MKLATINPAKTDYDLVIDLLSERVTRRGGMSLPRFAETCVVTAGPKKGERLSLENAPYSKRPFELMDPGHECQLCVLMWASQSMKSVTGQVTATYYSKEAPSEILYAMADLAGMRKTMNRRLSPLLMDQGVKFITQHETKGSRKKGDTTFSKEFAGGNLDGITANSSAALASETKRIFIADELGNWKAEIGDQGNPFYQGWARLKAWQDEKKCIIPSTPTDEESCMVWHLFQTGTMEEWWVPCHICGAYQILEVQNKDGYGLNWETRRGKVVESTIAYVCKSCSRAFTEKLKFEIQQAGEWRKPEDHEPVDKYTYSLHLHSINSMFESWREIASSYERGRDDSMARKYYNNHVAGMPHKTTAKRLNYKEVMKNRGDYQRGTVPDGVLYLVFGADIQGGAERWKDYTEEELEFEMEKARKEGDLHEKKFPRIEFEIMGRGPAYRSWSIDYRVLYGKTDNAYTGAFEKLYEWGVKLMEKNGGFGYLRKDGKLFPIAMLFIDSGHNATTVYDFTHRWNYTFPSKGDRILQAPKNSRNIQLHQSNFIPYKTSKVYGGTTLLYTISTKIYKKQLYQWLKVKRTDDEIQAAGFQDFPREYGVRYFDMLTAEEQTEEGEYTNRGRPNESLDCRVECMCAADVHLSQQVELMREKYRKEGWTQRQVEQIGSRWVVEYMAKKHGIDPRYLMTNQNNIKK